MIWYRLGTWLVANLDKEKHLKPDYAKLVSRTTLAISLLLAALLAGCGGGEQSSQGGGQGSQEEETTTAVLG